MDNALSVLSKPALLAAVSYIILAFAVLLPLGVNDPDAPRYDFGKRIMVVLLMLIPIGLSIYSVNCMVIGGCHIWSWINGIAIAVWVLLFIIASMISNQQVPSEVMDPLSMTRYV